MPKFSLLIPADADGTAHQISFLSQNPWAGIEQSWRDRRWSSAELRRDGEPVALVRRLKGSACWELIPGFESAEAVMRTQPPGEN